MAWELAGFLQLGLGPRAFGRASWGLMAADESWMELSHCEKYMY
jgi:hypothetical protein